MPLTDQPLPGPLLSGGDLRDAFAAAAQHLREVAKAVDAINVYPVPDGDTGSNMSATLREAVDRTHLAGDEPRVSAVLAELAKGALYGARGNSGVILSQTLRGFAAGVGDPDRLDAAALVSGLTQGATTAYSAVSKPQEGTMLTVLRVAGEAARSIVAELPDGGAGHPCLRLLAGVVRAAERAEAETIEQLPALKEAGVPDAGGEGVCVIFRGLLGYLSGTSPEPPSVPERPIALMAGHQGEAFGFCTEFLIEQETAPIDVEAVRVLSSAGTNRSVVVVGDERLARVHVHSDHPQQLLEAAKAYGRVARAKVEDMSAQHLRWGQTGSGAGARVAVLALSRGEGFDRVFRSLGARVTDLGEVEKPPAGEIAAAADALNIADVIVLPNHKNVVLAALQAVELARSTLHVVETVTLPQGVAAALAFDADESAVKNAGAMLHAAGAVRTVEVTRAAADRVADGVSVREGGAIAIAEGRLVSAAATYEEALLEGLRVAGVEGASLVTVYGGAELSEEETRALAGAVEAAFEGIEVEAIDAGQPLYAVIASIED